MFIEDFYQDNYKEIIESESKLQQQDSDLVQKQVIKNDIQIFHDSLWDLVNRNLDKDEQDFMKFSDKSLKQLRNKQNESIDQIYIIYKNPVPFKF